MEIQHILNVNVIKVPGTLIHNIIYIDVYIYVKKKTRLFVVFVVQLMRKAERKERKFYS